MPVFPILHYLPEFAQTHVHWWAAVYGVAQSRTRLKRLSGSSMSIESVMPSNHLILCCPFLLLPSIFPSIRVFSNELILPIRWPKYWSFSFSISPSNEYSGLISFLGLTGFDLLTVQGTLQSLLQDHNSKASVLWHSAFFTVQLSYRIYFNKNSKNKLWFLFF